MHTAIPINRAPLALQSAMWGSYAPPALRGLGQASLITGGISDGVQLASAAVNTWLNQIQLAHDADTATTQIVNGLAPKLQAVETAYMNGPGTCADQAAAEAAYMTGVDWLYSPAGCGNGAYGSAGNRCISDRFGPGGPTDPNAEYPWAAYYYLPIVNDPRAAGCAAQIASDNPDAALDSAVQNVVNAAGGSDVQTSAGMYDTAAGATTGSSASAAIPSSVVIGSTAIPTSYLLLGVAAIVAVMMMSK